MTKRKIYEVSFYFDLHAVTSPGVWLCPKGKVAVRVCLFGVSEVTKLLAPVFPLLFHERFHFQKVFKKAGCLPILENRLARLPICLQLLQYPQGTTSIVKLAGFKASLGDLLFPSTGADLNLIFYATKSYPGIIAPVAEVSTRLSLVESEIEGKSKLLPVTIYSKGISQKLKREHPIRQRAVCHTKHNLYCDCFANRSPKQQKRGKTMFKNNKSCQEQVPVYACDKHPHNVHGRYKNKSLIAHNDFESSFEIPTSVEQQNEYDRVNDYQTGWIENSNGKGIQDIDDNAFLNSQEYKQETRAPFSNKCDENIMSNSFEFRDDSPSRYISHNKDNKPYFEEHCRDNDTDKQMREAAYNELKREIKLYFLNRSRNKQLDCNNGVVCCQCCPKQQYNRRQFAESIELAKSKSTSCRNISPSCSECFLSACHSVHESTTDPNKVTFREDVRKRPLFYSNLHAAYERLCNKKNKKAIWK